MPWNPVKHFFEEVHTRALKFILRQSRYALESSPHPPLTATFSCFINPTCCYLSRFFSECIGPPMNHAPLWKQTFGWKKKKSVILGKKNYFIETSRVKWIENTCVFEFVCFFRIIRIFYFILIYFLALTFQGTNVRTWLRVCCKTVRGTQRQFSENICSEDALRSRTVLGTFVVRFLACLPLLGFLNI